MFSRLFGIFSVVCSNSLGTYIGKIHNILMTLVCFFVFIVSQSYFSSPVEAFVAGKKAFVIYVSQLAYVFRSFSSSTLGKNKISAWGLGILIHCVE